MEAKQLHLFKDEKILMQENFLDVLHHDAKKHGGMFCQVNITTDSSTKQKWSSKGSAALMVFDQEANHYIALNSFHQTKEMVEDAVTGEWKEEVTLKRDSNHLHAITCIFLDLDCHEESVGEIESRIYHTQKVLEDSYEEGLLPKPTMITETGRGLGIFYVLSRSIANSPKTQKQIRFWKYLCEEYGKKYDTILSSASEPCLEVDGSVIGDTARVVRLPGTWNLKAKKTCKLQMQEDYYGNPVYYSLQQLASHIEGYGVYDTKACKEKRRKLKISKTVDFAEFKNPILFERLKKLERCQELWIHEKESQREQLCFVYFNTARCLVGDIAAYRMMEEFNARFDYPIGKEELEPIIRQKTIYKFKDETLLKKLKLEDEENAYVGFGRSLKELKRQQTKEENQKKRSERNENIISYVVEHPEETYEEIAGLFGVSLRTLKNILKKADVHRYQKTQVNETFICAAENMESEDAKVEEITEDNIVKFIAPKEVLKNSRNRNEATQNSKVQKNACISTYMLSALNSNTSRVNNIITIEDKKKEKENHILMEYMVDRLSLGEQYVLSGDNGWHLLNEEDLQEVPFRESFVNEDG